MSTKETPFAKTARRHIAAGLNHAADRAKLTLGPWVRRAVDPPLWAEGDEGASSDPDAQLEKHFVRVGAQMATEVVALTTDAVGDGSTTALVLAQSIYAAGLELITAGSNPLDVRQGIEAAVAVVVSELEQLSKPVQSREQIIQVGAISAEGDATVGNLVADAVGHVGKAGVVTVNESESLENTLAFVAGMQLDCGYLSPYFVTDNERAEAVLDQPLVLICKSKLSHIRDLSSLLEGVTKAGKSLLIIGDVDGEALATLVASKVKGTLEVCIVKPPWRGDLRRELLTDIQVLSGGRIQALGLEPSLLVIEDLGRAKTIVVSKDSTILIGCAGSRDDIEKRLEQLRLQLDEAQSDEGRSCVRDRLARMAGGVATIRTPRATQKTAGRVESALHATRAAVEGGIVPGGGVALLHAIPALAKLRVADAQQAGVDIVRRALEQPLRQIALNGGLDGTAIVNEVRNREDGFGYNAITCSYEDLVASGVVDATKAVRVALQSAASVASRMLTTEPLLAQPVEQHAPIAADSDLSSLGGLAL